MKIEKFNFESMVTLNGNQVMTTSLKVAEYFGRKHKTVLRAIRNLNCSQEFNERNYVPVNYIDEKGEVREMFNLTRDGCMFLIMGFTGEKAAQIKEAYINAFNWMAEKLQSSQSSLLKELTSSPFFRAGRMSSKRLWLQRFSYFPKKEIVENYI